MSDMEIKLAGEQDERALKVMGAEVDIQVATAKHFPRSVTKALKDAITMATISREMAESCIYNVPRGGGSIPGPSIRLAEIMQASWGNIRCKGRVVSVGATHVIAEGIAWDLETNSVVSKEASRRITNKYGKRYTDDMITSTSNAAISIAIRNALFSVVPRAIMMQVYDKARDAAVGTIKTIAERRSDALRKLAVFGITKERVLSRLGKHGLEDITLEDLELLFGLYNSVRDEDETPDEAFPEPKLDIDPKPATKKEEPKEKVTVEKTGEPEPEKAEAEVTDNTAGYLDMTLAAIQERARADFVAEEMLKEFRMELGVVEDDKRTHTDERLAKLQKKIVKFIG